MSMIDSIDHQSAGLRKRVVGFRISSFFWLRSHVEKVPIITTPPRKSHPEKVARNDFSRLPSLAVRVLLEGRRDLRQIEPMPAGEGAPAPLNCKVTLGRPDIDEATDGSARNFLASRGSTRATPSSPSGNPEACGIA